VNILQIDIHIVQDYKFELEIELRIKGERNMNYKSMENYY
jgi:hypothetical protein